MSNRATRAQPAEANPVDPDDHADGAAVGDATRHMAAACKRIEAARLHALESKRHNWRWAGNAVYEIESAERDLLLARRALGLATRGRL